MFQKSERNKTEKDEIIMQLSGPVSVTEWSDKKIVNIISTYHSHDTGTVAFSGKDTVKPISLLDFNHFMGRADLERPFAAFLCD
jgi:hypothetical protein